MPQSLCPPLVITSSGRLGLDAERRLFHALRDGGDMRARDALIDRFMPLARSVARRYRFVFCTRARHSSRVYRRPGSSDRKEWNPPGQATLHGG